MLRAVSHAGDPPTPSVSPSADPPSARPKLERERAPAPPGFAAQREAEAQEELTAAAMGGRTGCDVGGPRKGQALNGREDG